jgi:hypothetical protein
MTTVDHALDKWKYSSPPNHWLKLEMGVDGWVVQVLKHDSEFGDIKVVFERDDYSANGLAEVIESAYAAALGSECSGE